LAAAGIYALQNNINRLEEDHRRAKELGMQLEKCSWVSVVEPIETNIVVFSPFPHIDDKLVIEKLKQKGISISVLSKGKLRIVTHLDYRQIMHEYVLEALEKLNF
jgi:threonine aldolase